MKYDYKNNEFNINTKRSKKLITLMETKHQDTPDPYKFWLEKEINEQPISINRALGYGSRILDDNIINLGGLYENKDKLKNIENIVIVGCGTSYYAGLLGKYYFNELTNMAQLTEEVGEVARIIARRYGEQSEKESDKEKDLAEELADVLFVVLCLANQTGIDLQQAFDRKLDIKAKRDHDRHQNNKKLK